jgi:hypothetical protein
LNLRPPEPHAIADDFINTRFYVSILFRDGRMYKQ